MSSKSLNNYFGITVKKINNCKVQFKFTVFRVELFGVELPACTVIRCRVFV